MAFLDLALSWLYVAFLGVGFLTSVPSSTATLARLRRATVLLRVAVGLAWADLFVTSLRAEGAVWVILAAITAFSAVGIAYSVRDRRDRRAAEMLADAERTVRDFRG